MSRKLDFVGIWKWWPEADSNRRHRDFQSLALPTELSGLLKLNEIIHKNFENQLKTSCLNLSPRSL